MPTGVAGTDDRQTRMGTDPVLGAFSKLVTRRWATQCPLDFQKSCPPFLPAQARRILYRAIFASIRLQLA